MYLITWNQDIEERHTSEIRLNGEGKRQHGDYFQHF